MPVTLDATPGGPASNSYLTLAEGNTYFETRLHASVWDDSSEQEKALMMATRVLDILVQPFKWLVTGTTVGTSFFKTRRQWTGTPATTTQKLAWPRKSMYDLNGNAIAVNVIPSALKEGTAELAFQLLSADRTLDSDVQSQGITSLKAGSVAITFKDMVEAKVIPDAVWNLMPPSWFTDEQIIAAVEAQFEVV
jgi:hypothetical protein